MAEDSLAILPNSMGKQPPGAQPKKVDARKFIPGQKGGLLLSDPKAEECPYTFSDSPAYLRNKKAEQDAKRAAELEGKDDTRGFLRSVEELAKKQRWEEAFQFLERRTAAPSGLFLVTRAVLRWKFERHRSALADAQHALEQYSSSSKAGPLAAAFACFARICLGSQAHEKESCSKEMRPLVEAWERSEEETRRAHALGQGLFRPRPADRLQGPAQLEGEMEAIDGTYVAATGVRIGYAFLRCRQGSQAPLLVHFHGDSETAAMYREPELAGKYRDLGCHLLVADYRGYGWSDGQPSLATCLHDAEVLAEKLPALLVEFGLPWPYPGGLVLSGRSVGAQVAVHVATMFPNLFRSLVLDSAVATAATGDRLGRAPERRQALECWRKELEKASLEVLHPLDADLRCLSALEKLQSFGGRLLVLHGLADELVPHEGSESLHAAAGTKTKEIVLIEEAGHNNIGRFDAYWSAIRRLCSTVQLDCVLPSVGDRVEHLCAVCAEKAASKCGRCQRVWYCSRAHQADHWKSHKLTCAGGPPEPKEKVVPESDAHIIGVMFAHIGGDADVNAFSNALRSLATQDGPPLQALHLGWRCESPALVERVAAIVEEHRASVGGGFAIASAEASGLFEHSLAVLARLPGDLNANTWISFLAGNEILSRQHLALLHPAMRRASADARVAAVSCPQHARRCVDAGVKDAPPSSAEDVVARLSSSAAEISAEEPETSPAGIVVRLQALKSFLDTTPAQARAHPLCAMRLRRKLAASFGKKVQTFTPPEGEWMRWVPCGASASSASQDSRGVGAPTDADKARAATIRRSLEQMESAAAAAAAVAPTEAVGEAGTEGAGVVSALPAVVKHRLGTLEVAEREVAALRWGMERALILRAGDSMTPRELRDLANDHMHAFLEEVGLHEVIGLERWARETAEAMARECAEHFDVKVFEGAA